MITNQLYDLVHDGNVTAAREWLDEKPDDLNAAVGDGYAPLHVACLFGYPEAVEMLLGREALVNINAENASRTTPLHLAISYREETVADKISRVLIDHGAELNAKQTGGQTPLHHAVARASVLLTRTLVQAGADPFLKDDFGHSASDLAKELIGEAADRADAIRAELKQAHSLN